MKLSSLLDGTSWKTTLSGVCAIVTAVAAAVLAFVDDDPATKVEIATTIAAVMAGVGLIAARDNNKSSEDIGVGK